MGELAEGSVIRLLRAGHQLNEALHANNLWPEEVEIHLPQKDWWNFYMLVLQQTEHMVLPKYDGRAPDVTSFRYMGITWKMKGSMT